MCEQGLMGKDILGHIAAFGLWDSILACLVRMWLGLDSDVCRELLSSWRHAGMAAQQRCSRNMFYLTLLQLL